jgi:hypothetical protein
MVLLPILDAAVKGYIPVVGVLMFSKWRCGDFRPDWVECDGSSRASCKACNVEVYDTVGTASRELGAPW